MAPTPFLHAPKAIDIEGGNSATTIPGVFPLFGLRLMKGLTLSDDQTVLAEDVPRPSSRNMRAPDELDTSSRPRQPSARSKIWTVSQ